MLKKRRAKKKPEEVREAPPSVPDLCQIELRFPDIQEVAAVYEGLVTSMHLIPKHTDNYELSRESSRQITEWSRLHVRSVDSANVLINVANGYLTARGPRDSHRAHAQMVDEVQKIQADVQRAMELHRAAIPLVFKIMAANIALDFLSELGATLEVGEIHSIAL